MNNIPFCFSDLIQLGVLKVIKQGHLTLYLLCRHYLGFECCFFAVCIHCVIILLFFFYSYDKTLKMVILHLPFQAMIQ